MDVQIRSFPKENTKVVEGQQVTETVTIFELFTHSVIENELVEFKKAYDVEPTNDQRAAFEGEARQHFERQAKRKGVTLDDPGVTLAAQPQLEQPRPVSHAKAPTGTTAKKK